MSPPLRSPPSDPRRHAGTFINIVLVLLLAFNLITHRQKDVVTLTMVVDKETTGNAASTGSSPPVARSTRMKDYANVKVIKKSDTKRGGDRGKRKVRQISLIGERNSGSTWIAAHLEDCFGHGVDVNNSLVRYKHWFQTDHDVSKRVYDTLVVAMFRNPYHWVEAMRARPHHSPNHYLRDWREFVTLPWTMPRTEADLELLRRHPGVDPSSIPCQAGYNYTQINSCKPKPFTEEAYAKFYEYLEGRNESLNHPRYSSRYPQYELRMDGSGEPYNNVLDLRVAKIENTFEVAEWAWVRELIVTQYEELVAKGTDTLVKHIAMATGVEARCSAYAPQDRPQRELDSEFVEYMNDHVDWEVEKTIGYTKRSPGKDKRGTSFKRDWFRKIVSLGNKFTTVVQKAVDGGLVT